MKKIYYCLICISLFVGCASSKKLLEKGEYDKAIAKSATILRKSPNDTKELQVLKEAYKKANRFNNERIQFLQKENRSENSYEIYQLYTLLNRRQQVVESLPAKLQNQFTYFNYDDDIIQMKKAAAENFYKQGLKYLNDGGRENARLAYSQFVRVKNIYSDYRNTNQLMNEAHFAGTTNILFRINNQSNIQLPINIENDIRNISLKDLNSFWLNYDTYPDTLVRYHYYVELNLKRIHISPEVIEKKYFSDIKKVRDGMKYVLDSNGNVKKDSSGNDIKVPRMINVVANVKETIQHEEAFIGGSLDYVSLQDNQLIKSEPLSASSVFDHHSANMKGDKRALSEKDRKLIKNHPLPFPSNGAMLLDAAQHLKKQAKDIIFNNRNMFKN